MTSATATPLHGLPASPGTTLYWRASGIALAAVAGLGIVLNALGAGALLGEGFLAFDWTHNILHVVLALVALGLGFSGAPAGVLKGAAKLVGLVYLGLGVLGFVGPVVGLLDSLLGLHVELGENLVHILLGAWGAYVGFTDA